MALIKYYAQAKKDRTRGTTSWYATIQPIYSNINSDAVIDYAVMNSKIERSVLQQAAIGIANAVKNFVCNGHSVNLAPLGTFRPVITSVGSATAAEVSAANIRGVRIAFSPGRGLSQMRKLVGVRLEKTDYGTKTGA